MEEQHKRQNLEHICALVVDDDKFSRTFVKTALFQIGLKNIKEASSAKEAEEVLLANPIDIILLDQVMPEESGIDFVSEMQYNHKQAFADIPIIMITVDTREQTVLKAKQLGIKEYLVKPISPSALKKRICNVFNIEERI